MSTIKHELLTVFLPHRRANGRDQTAIRGTLALLLTVVLTLALTPAQLVYAQTPEPDPSATAQQEIAAEDVLPPVLSVDELYAEMSPELIYGRTAIELLRELETKHYSSVTFDDRFGGEVFDNFMDALDSQKLYFLQK